MESLNNLFATIRNPLLLGSILILSSACNENAADGIVGVAASDPGRAVLVTGISSASFPSTSINTTSSINVNVSNAGTNAATLSAATFSGTYASITGDTCSGTSLAVGAFCSLTLNFAPLTVVNTIEKLSIPYNGGGSFTLSNNFSASSTAPDPSIVTSPTAYDFGAIQIGSTGTHSFVISNSSSGPATFQASTISGVGFTITTDNCSGVSNMIAGGSTCTVTVQFAPTVAGTILSTLTLHFQNNFGTALSKTVSISAIGASAQPSLTLSPNPYNFLSVPTNTHANQTIGVSNTAAANATVGVPSISGAGFTIDSQNCAHVVLVQNANCQAIIGFTPTTTGVASGTFTVPYTAADGTAYTATVPLGGTGTTPATSFTFAGATSASNLSATGATLNWTAQSLAAYYIVRWTTGATTVASAHYAPTSLNSYNITGLNANTTYTLRVNAYDSNDNSDGNVATISITTPNVTGATFNGWSDVVALGDVFTDIGTVDTSSGNTGANRWERNLGAVAGFDSTNVNTTNGQISAATTFATGTAVKFNSDGTAPSGLTIGNTYYVINVSATIMQLASTAANATAGTAITLATVGSGNMTLMPRSVVKLGWEIFTYTPTASANSYNIYRDTSAAFTTSTLVGTSTTNTFSDWAPTMQTTYYYKVKPVVSGVEIEPTAVTDSVIQVFVPPTDMSLMHRWMVNREACTTLLGVTYSSGVNRNTNYSCAYAWGGTSYGTNATSYDKTKWDLGYSLIVDRWQNGCKMKSYGATAPTTGGSTNDVFLKTGAGTATTGNPASCYIKDSVSGWTVETGTLTSASRGLIRTNYPGYSTTGAYQGQAYNSCQQRVIAGVTDGNSNTTLRLMRTHEAVLARAIQGVNINYRSPVTLANIFSGIALPTNGSCNTTFNNATASNLDGVTIPNPSTYSLTLSELMNGSVLTKNCYSRYEISNLWDAMFEHLSSQYYGPSTTNAGYFVASALDPNDNLLEGFLMNGVIGSSNSQGVAQNIFGSSSATQIVLPLFGVRAVSVDATLGTKNITMANLDYGTRPTNNYSSISPSGAAANGVILGSLGSQGPNNHYFPASRYQFSMTSLNYITTGWSNYTPIGSRCAGQVGP